MKTIEEVQEERARLAAEYEPLIAEARREAEAANAAFEQARAARDAATDKHLKLVNQFEDARVNVGRA